MPDEVERRLPPRQRGAVYRRRVAGAMLLAVGLASLLSLAVLPGLEANALMAVCAGAAVALGAVLVLSPASPPEWSSQLLIGFVSVLITVGIASGGPASAVGDLQVLYVPTAVYAFYFFATRQGLLQSAFAGLCYAVYLSTSDGGVAADVSRWLTTMGAMLVAGAMVRAMTLEVERLVGELALAATRDALTGVWNRRGFDERVDVELARARRSGEPLTLVAVDVDGLKRVNDTRGHAAGDAAIKLTARALGQDLRDLDSLGRIGGDEFLLLLPACDLASGERIANEMRARLTAAAERDGSTITASFGVAASPPSMLDGRALRAHADAALYAAKGLGRDRVVAVGADDEPVAPRPAHAVQTG